MHCLFDATKNKHDYYRGNRGKYCMKKFSKDLKKQPTKIINYIKKVTLTNKENKSYHKQKVYIYAKKNLIPMAMEVHSNYTMKCEITATTPANIEVLLIIFVT